MILGGRHTYAIMYIIKQSMNSMKRGWDQCRQLVGLHAVGVQTHSSICHSKKSKSKTVDVPGRIRTSGFSEHLYGPIIIRPQRDDLTTNRQGHLHTYVPG
jgi:hypothetical protein